MSIGSSPATCEASVRPRSSTTSVVTRPTGDVVVRVRVVLFHTLVHVFPFRVVVVVSVVQPSGLMADVGAASVDSSRGGGAEAALDCAGSLLGEEHAQSARSRVAAHRACPRGGICMHRLVSHRGALANTRQRRGIAHGSLGRCSQNEHTGAARRPGAEPQVDTEVLAGLAARATAPFGPGAGALELRLRPE